MAHTLVNLDVCALTAAKGVASDSVLSILGRCGDKRLDLGLVQGPGRCAKLETVTIVKK